MLAVATIGLVAVTVRYVPITEWIIGLAGRLRGMGASGVALFIGVYVVAEIALVPGSLLTLAAGFAYGPIGGLLVASPASVLAATAAFFMGRTVRLDVDLPPRSRGRHAGSRTRVVRQ